MRKIFLTAVILLLLAVVVFASTTASKQLSITINPAPAAVLVITNTSLPAGAATVSYSAALAASGGVAPYIWSISAGTLPAGLSLAPATGIISGTPTTQGLYNFTVTVTDASSNTASVRVRGRVS